VGGGAGTWKGGKHLVLADKPSQANLLLTIMDKFGVPIEKGPGATAIAAAQQEAARSAS
jgi:hypothetical protein